MKHEPIKAIGGGLYFSTITGGSYETAKRDIEPDAGLRTRGPFPWARWGFDNNYPQRLIDALTADPSATLIERRRAMHWGKGLMFYKKSVDDKGNERIEVIPDEKVPAEIEDFFWMNDFENFMQGIIADFEWWHKFYVQYIADGTGKISQIKWQRMKDCRPELINRKTG
ncbi:MAG: hypothetical protein WDO15_11405 [Bacteroidota bacterium]